MISRKAVDDAVDWSGYLYSLHQQGADGICNADFDKMCGD
jgi:hypothetical protein